jgi:hypothetical protein
MPYTVGSINNYRFTCKKCGHSWTELCGCKTTYFNGYYGYESTYLPFPKRCYVCGGKLEKKNIDLDIFEISNFDWKDLDNW